MKELIEAKFSIGDVIKHKFLDFRGVIFDLDRPAKEQPFYHVFAENKDIFYIAYVSEQNLVLENLNKPANHPNVSSIFSHFESGSHVPASRARN
jgi:heat shock protein HspQ